LSKRSVLMCLREEVHSPNPIREVAQALGVVAQAFSLRSFVVPRSILPQPTLLSTLLLEASLSLLKSDL